MNCEENFHEKLPSYVSAFNPTYTAKQSKIY